MGKQVKCTVLQFPNNSELLKILDRSWKNAKIFSPLLTTSKKNPSKLMLCYRNDLWVALEVLVMPVVTAGRDDFLDVVSKHSLVKWANSWDAQ